ncbi:hypothetical protein DERF_003295 [Dermatophagoides farinae]|uniref:Uncharacterized protein n=1 Tax=Dermatophagoides farinae TaxID=6954 RepID=A0A922IGJ8_DERFA|nr:hypothetical protein DERF_003295 [Dermatophagoides farinae]
MKIIELLHCMYIHNNQSCILSTISASQPNSRMIGSQTHEFPHQSSARFFLLLLLMIARLNCMAASGYVQGLNIKLLHLRIGEKKLGLIIICFFSLILFCSSHLLYMPLISTDGWMSNSFFFGNCRNNWTFHFKTGIFFFGTNGAIIPLALLFAVILELKTKNAYNNNSHSPLTHCRLFVGFFSLTRFNILANFSYYTFHLSNNKATINAINNITACGDNMWLDIYLVMIIGLCLINFDQCIHIPCMNHQNIENPFKMTVYLYHIIITIPPAEQQLNIAQYEQLQIYKGIVMAKYSLIMYQILSRTTPLHSFRPHVCIKSRQFLWSLHGSKVIELMQQTIDAWNFFLPYHEKNRKPNQIILSIFEAYTY